MSRFAHHRSWLLAVVLAATPLAAATAEPRAAQSQAQTSPEQRQATELGAALAVADAAAMAGPAEIRMFDQATLSIPKGTLFVPEDAAKRLHRALGNSGDRQIFGILVDNLAAPRYFGVLRYSPDGYVRDDDAKDWDPAALLKALQEGTESGNAERRRRGFAEIEATGWKETPTYDAASHRLVWALGMREKGEAEPSGVNYNTRMLGREGYISLNMLSAQERLVADKAVANRLLDGLHFVEGKRYEDFDSRTDKVAALGLAGLLGVVAAKKLGFFALALAFVAKGGKIAILAGVALIGGLAKLMRRKPA